MSVTDEYLTYVIDQLYDLGPVTSRRMFGGAGLYCDGVMFAIVDDDMLYFKVDDGNRADYEAAGTDPFTYTTDRGTSTMSYYEVPIDVLENKEQAARWAQKALAVALEAKKNAKTKPPAKLKSKRKKK